MLYTDVIKFTS